MLLLTTGLSGSGKTWLARRLAPDLGAVHLRSDVERKRLAGLAERADSRSALGEDLYSPENTARIYAHSAMRRSHCSRSGSKTVTSPAAMLPRLI